MMRLGFVGVAALCLPLLAQTPDRKPDIQAEPRVGVGDETRRLSLEEALQLALKNNLEIELERENVKNAQQIFRAAQGIFDTVLVYQPSIASINTPTASTLVAASGKQAQRIHNENVGVRQQTPYQGLSLQIDFNNQRQSINNPFNTLNPIYQSQLSVSLVLPLLRGRVIDQQRAAIRIRSKQLDQSKTDFETRVVNLITRAQSAYWDLVAALSDASVAREGVDLAREQRDRTKRQIDAGTLAPVELAASEAELQRRIDTYVSTVGIVTQAENNLKSFVTPGREDAMWNQKIDPTDPRPLEEPKLAVSDAVNLALKQRPELKAVDLQADQAKVQTRLAQNQLKPQVNLTGNYYNTGIAGPITNSQNPFGSQAAYYERINELSSLANLTPLPSINFGSGPPPGLTGGYGTALSNLFSGNFQSVQAGLNIQWNPRNREAEAVLAQANIAERRLRLSRKQVEQGVEVEVRNALQALETSRQRIEAAQASEHAAREKLDSEIRLFQTGESTNFLVLTRQNELLDSQRRSVQATLDRNRAISEAQRVLGEVLKAHQIELQ